MDWMASGHGYSSHDRHFLINQKENTMIQLTVHDLNTKGRQILLNMLGEAKITGGGIYVFKPGETAHPEPRHVHDVDEVFIFLQGSGVIPIDGTDYPVKAGAVVVVAAGEDHHTRSSIEDPLVAAWYLTDRSSLR
jgi:mannose-6-phosphate isomerase-like protein (cupin superfamily)